MYEGRGIEEKKKYGVAVPVFSSDLVKEEPASGTRVRCSLILKADPKFYHIVVVQKEGESIRVEV